MKITCNLYDDCTKKILKVQSEFSDKKTKDVIIEIENEYVIVDALELIESINTCSNIKNNIYRDKGN